eukprot:gene1694-biopygen19866
MGTWCRIRCSGWEPGATSGVQDGYLIPHPVFRMGTRYAHPEIVPGTPNEPQRIVGIPRHPAGKQFRPPARHICQNVNFWAEPGHLQPRLLLTMQEDRTARRGLRRGSQQQSQGACLHTAVSACVRVCSAGTSPSDAWPKANTTKSPLQREVPCAVRRAASLAGEQRRLTQAGTSGRIVLSEKKHESHVNIRAAIRTAARALAFQQEPISKVYRAALGARLVETAITGKSTPPPFQGGGVCQSCCSGISAILDSQSDSDSDPPSVFVTGRPLEPKCFLSCYDFRGPPQTAGGRESESVTSVADSDPGD